MYTRFSFLQAVRPLFSEFFRKKPGKSPETAGKRREAPPSAPFFAPRIRPAPRQNLYQPLQPPHILMETYQATKGDAMPPQFFKFAV